MRVRPALLLGAVFGAALLLAAFVVAEVVRESRRAARPDLPAPPAPAAGLAVLAAEPGRAEGGVLAGRVRGAAAVEGAVVAATPLARGAAARGARATAAADGAYELPLTPGDYRVVAVPAGVDPAEARASPSFARISAGATTRLDPALPPAEPPGVVEISIRTAGGAPAPGAAVTLARAGDRRVALSGKARDDGRLLLSGELGLAGRAVTVEATLADRRGSWTGTLPERGEVEVTLDGLVERAPGAPRPPR